MLWCCGAVVPWCRGAVGVLCVRVCKCVYVSVNGVCANVRRPPPRRGV